MVQKLDVLQAKDALHRMVLETEDLDLLNKLIGIFDVLRKEDATVAYTADGKPLDRKAFREKIREAEANVKAGRVYTSGQVLEEMEKWKKSLQ